MDDDPRLALFLDKIGLGHNGERLSEGGHIIFFVNDTFGEYISGAKWSAFLEEQQELLAERKKKKQQQKKK